MNRKRLYRILLTALAAAILLAGFTVCALAVPSNPGAGRTGEAAACRSHHGAPVTLDSIPARQSGAMRAPSVPHAQKDLPLLIVVVGFSNVAYEDGWDWSEKIFSGPKSLSAYYADMSFGKFTFVPAAETAAFGAGDNTNTEDKVNDGVVHVKLDSAHMDWANEEEYVSQAAAMCDALYAAEAYVDFASYDADRDGRIETNELAVGFVFAGYEASIAAGYPQGIEKYLWAHAWTIHEIADMYDAELPLPTPDGVAVDAYISVAEQLEPGECEPISLFAHELGHYLGLPDLYPTSSVTVGGWGKYNVSDYSVMASGSWGTDPDGGYIPYSMDVWSRYALGWCEPQTAETAGDYTVAAQSYAADEAFNALYIPTGRENEYYLLENLQFTKWDAGLAKTHTESGIIVWHIDDEVFETHFAANQVNDRGHRPAVMPLYPERLDGAYTYIGNTTVVMTSRGFCSASVWTSLFGENAAPLDLPLYGEGENADNRAARTLSGMKLGFMDDSAPAMRVRFLPAGHTPSLREVAAAAPTCTAPGVIAHWVCEDCGLTYADADGLAPIPAGSVSIPATGHSYAAPVWTWKENYGVATAAFVCGCGDTVELTDPETVWTEVSPATDVLDQVVRYTASVTFDGVEYTAVSDPVTLLGTATGAPEQPGDTPDQASGDLCPLDGQDHGSSFMGRLIRFFHGIAYFFRHLFGRA